MPAGPIARSQQTRQGADRCRREDDGPRAQQQAGSDAERSGREGAAKKAAAEKKAEELADSVIGSRYTTAALKLRTEPAKDAESVNVIDEAEKLKVTETVKKGYRQVVVKGKARWVTDDYLRKKKPSAELRRHLERLLQHEQRHRVRPRGQRQEGLPGHLRSLPGGELLRWAPGDNDFHGSGQAVDAMISDSGAGWRLANWVRANASKLGVSEVIYSQKIWTVQRSGEGWRGMSDRGSSTANHYDHVHVSVY